MRQLLLLSFVAGFVACVDAAPPLPLGQTDGGSQSRPDAGSPDATTQRSYPITVYDKAGQRAPSALVYELNDSKGRLLGRTDADGVFFVNSPAEILVRRGFDQVEIQQLTSDENVDIYLSPIEDRPQTQDLFGVGLESSLFRGEIFRALTIGQWVIAAEAEVTSQGLFVTSVHIDAATGDVRRMPLPSRPSGSNAYESFLLPVDEETAAVVLTNGQNDGLKDGNVTFLEVRTGNIISTYNFVRAINPRPFSDGEGEFALLSTTVSGQLHVDHFDVNTSQGIRRAQIDFAYPASNAVGIGLRNGRAYFEDGPNVVAAEVSSRSIQVAIANALGFSGCGTSCWFGPTGIHHLGIDDVGELIYSGDAQSGPYSLGFFDSAALVLHPRGDVALAIGQRARPDKYSLVDPINATYVDLPISEYLDGVTLSDDGDDYAVFAQTIGPAYYRFGRDGAGFQRVEVPSPDGLDCVFPQLAVSDLETKRRWLACGTGEPQHRQLYETDTGVQRNFFSSAQYTQHATSGPWIYFYDFDPSSFDVGIHAINTEALR